MKKNAPFFLLLAVLLVGGLYVSKTQSVPFVDEPVQLASAGSPGEGYFAEDDCGYLMGISMASPSAPSYIDVDGMSPDSKQACADLTGNFYSGGFLSTVDSRAYLHSLATDETYTLDFVGDNYGVTIDHTDPDRYWSGYAKITDASYTGTNRWVWFDWNCVAGDDKSGVAECGSGILSRAYRVHTNEDGTVEGYAWNDDLGFIPFRDLTLEMPPQQIQMFVDVYALEDTSVTPDNVTLATAPFSDYAQYWRVRLQWMDVSTGLYLNEDDFVEDSITIDTTTVGNVFLNQVENFGDAVTVTAYNPYLGCDLATAEYCGLTDPDGYWSANLFVYSGSPTSNMLGYNSDSDAGIENYLDREGCRWIYTDQWQYVEVPPYSSQPKCPVSTGSSYDKEDVFYLRENDRNMIGLESMDMRFHFDSDREVSVTSASGVLSEVSDVAGVTYTYTPDYNADYDGDGTADGLFLSYRPRFQPISYVAVYDGEEYTQISADYMRYSVPPYMDLKTHATVYDASAEARERGVVVKPAFTIYDQLDVVRVSGDPVATKDRYLIVDTIDDADSNPDCSYADVPVGGGSYPNDYISHFNLGYGQRSATCQGGIAPSGTPINSVSDPTAEQWVCDSVTVHFNDNVESCYYTGYLPIVDVHDEPEDMLVLGAINSLLNDEDVLTNLDQIFSQGSLETIKLRNKMYSQVVRYTLGQTAGSGSLDSSMNPDTGNIISLMNDRLLFARGDVTITGSEGFADKTLVTIGGDVYIDGNITGGRLGIISFADNEVGGKVYVNPIVTDIYANIFADGGFYSYGGTSTVTTGVPAWANDETRVEILRNQLYLNGSLVARNTVNGSVDSDGDGYLEIGDGTLVSEATLYPMDDGNQQSGYAIAREHDLNMIRQYRLCWPVDPATGLPDESDPTARIDCGEADLSSYRDENGDPVYSSFILEYSAPSNLLIFTAENGLN